MQSKHGCLPLEIRFYRTTNLDGVLLLLAIYLAVGAFAAVCKTDGTAKNNCVADQCDTVGDTEICMQCNQGKVPINGGCATADDAKTKCTTADGDGTQASDQTCKKCLLETFMYKGGCYETTSPAGQQLCTKAAEGVCSAPAPGYFLNPLSASDKDSVVACSDTTGFTETSKTYKGVENCEACDGSGLKADASGTVKCTRCGGGKYLKDNACVTDANACGNGYAAKEDSENGNRCIKCGDAASGGIADCTQCIASTSPARSVTPLVTCSQCSNKKVQPNKKGRIDSCPANSSDKSGVCECNSGYAPDAAGTGCTQDTTPQCKTPDCKACDNPAEDSEVCTTCNENKYLTPTGQCVDDCEKLGNYYGATDRTCKECTVVNCAECDADGSCKMCRTGFFPNNNECKPCDSSCKSCSGATNADCTECPSGKVLKYGNDDTKGTCGEGCTTGTGQSACKTCDLTVEGTKYCSGCSKSDEYPQNSVCSSATSCAAATCKTGSVSNGACTSCNDGFFLMEGRLVPAARVSRFADLRGWAGLPSVASWRFLGSCPAGGHRFSESHWRPLGVQFMSVSKRFGSLCSGARGSEVGGERVAG